MLSLPVERVKVIASDTSLMANVGSASASRLTYMSGNAVKGVAEQTLAAWQNEERPAVGEFTYLAPKTTKLDPETGQGKPNFAYGYVAEVAVVAVDTETGQVKVERFISVDDVGQAINPQQVTGQIEGAAVQALGYAVLEDWKSGRAASHRQIQHLPDSDRAGRARSDGCADRRGARSQRPLRRGAWARCPICRPRPRSAPRCTTRSVCGSTSSR